MFDIYGGLNFSVPIFPLIRKAWASSISRVRSGYFQILKIYSCVSTGCIRLIFLSADTVLK